MPKPIDEEEKRKWRGYLSSPQPLPLTPAIVRALAAKWIDGPLDPDDPGISAIISKIDESAVHLDFRSRGYSKPIPFDEIIAAENVICYWLAKGQAPLTDDFRHPGPEIEVPGISYKTYAPRLAERIKRELLELSTPIARDDAGISDSIESPPYVPLEDDQRRLIDRQIRERRGQTGFRNSLRAKYGDRCLVTGCTVLAVLEAAHIRPYRGESDNNPENGLLLRADIHTLFDLDLLGIEPDQLQIELHPAAASDSQYEALNGKALACPSGNRPSQAALRLRYLVFKERQKSKR